jgi:pyrroline-5-carboxylate reductase
MTQRALPPLLLIGGGKMGSAMLAGWRERGLSTASVVDPSPAAADLAAPGVAVYPTLAAVPPAFTPACIVLAVKPQQAAVVLPEVVRFPAALVLSIMAGKTIAGLAAAMPANAIVRAMPNTPAAIGRGITVAVAGPGVSPPQRTLADTLLAAVGEVAWVEDEALIDPVTAISGGGPAYVFLLAELLEAAGLEQGLSPALARQLARATIAGSGALLAASTEDAAALRIAVTSPAGTTERALRVLMAPTAWPAAVSTAIADATTRSRELGA